MNRITLTAVAFLALIAVSEATLGVDVSTAVSTSNFQCMINSGYTYAIVRCYRSSGTVDSNCPTTIKNAWSAGMKRVSAYMFPCYSCGNPAGQVDTLYNYLKGTKYNVVWFDIEGPQYWSSNTQSNVNFLQSMINEAKSLGMPFGIYTSQSQWSTIMGSSTIGSSSPLWYAHYDNKASFSDFVPFGGWTRPAMKQYVGDTTLCSTGIDKDYSRPE